MNILADLFELREEPVAILSTLIMSFVDLYRARAAKDSGASQAQAAERFGYKGREFRVRNAWNSRLSAAALTDALDILNRCDRSLKGSGVDGRILLEQTVVRLLRVCA
jgi:DNA polymerase-3 subunit delta